MDQEIRESYAQGFEPGRLRVGGNGRLEFLRTQEIVRRFVGERSRVLDAAYADPELLDYLMWALRARPSRRSRCWAGRPTRSRWRDEPRAEVPPWSTMCTND